MSTVNAGTYKQLLKKLGGKDKAREGLIQGVIVVVFALIQQFYVDENFKCPCYNEATPENCERARSYSIVFITMTTLGAGFVGFVILSTIKCVLSFGKKSKYAVKFDASSGKVDIQHGGFSGAVVPNPSPNVEEVGDDSGNEGNGQENPSTSGGGDGGKRGQVPRTSSDSGTCINFSYGFRTKYCCKKFAEACLICMAWFSLLLLDGDYIACASVCNPYGSASCLEIRGSPQDELPFTLSFARARRISQYVGMGLLAAVVLVIALIKFCNISCSGCTCGCACQSSCGCCKKCCRCEYDEKLRSSGDEPKVEELLLAFQSTAESAAKKAFKDIQRPIA